MQWSTPRPAAAPESAARKNERAGGAPSHSNTVGIMSALSYAAAAWPWAMPGPAAANQPCGVWLPERPLRNRSPLGQRTSPYSSEVTPLDLSEEWGGSHRITRSGRYRRNGASQPTSSSTRNTPCMTGLPVSISRKLRRARSSSVTRVGTSSGATQPSASLPLRFSRM